MSTDTFALGGRLRRGVREATSLERALWALVGLALVGDVATTFLGLHLGLTESNPIARTAIEGWGLAGMIGMKVAAVGVALCCVPLVPDEYRSVVPAGLALPWMFAVIVNCYMISLVL